MSSAAATLALLLRASAPEVAAPEATTASATWVASIRAPSLLAGGVDAQVERYFFEDRWSAASSAGYAAPVSGSYDGRELALGVELRRWLWRGGPATSFDGRSLGGAFASARLDGGVGELRRDGRLVDRSVRLSGAVGAGYRLLPVWRVEVTPSAALAVTGHRSVEGRAGPLLGVRVQLGLTVGLVL